MKKLNLFIAFAILLSVQAWGQESESRSNYRIFDIKDSPVKDNASLYLYNRTVFYLEGFDFKQYRRNDPNLNSVTAAEAKGIQNGIWNSGKTAIRVPKATGAYSVIGHSQGGLRAIGHISEVQRTRGTTALNNIDAVITVSGINQGLPMLNGGIPGFWSRASEKINIVGNGLRASVGILDVFNILGFLFPRDQLANTVGAASGFFVKIVPERMRPYWVEAIANPRTGVLPQIDDMAPRSSYITRNIVKTVDHTYKVKTGERLTSEWRKRTSFPKIWYLWIGYVPVYSYYTMPESIPVFDSTVPIGFIAGADNNTLGMGGNEASVRKDIKAAREFFGAVRTVHIVKNSLIVGLLSGGLTYERDAYRTEQLMANIDSELNGVKGSSQGDGLVALSSQYIPKTFKDPNTGVTRTNLKNPVLGNVKSGFVGMPYNHKDIIERAGTFYEAGLMVEEARKLRRR